MESRPQKSRGKEHHQGASGKVFARGMNQAKPSRICVPRRRMLNGGWQAGSDRGPGVTGEISGRNIRFAENMLHAAEFGNAELIKQIIKLVIQCIYNNHIVRNIYIYLVI